MNFSKIEVFLRKHNTNSFSWYYTSKRVDCYEILVPSEILEPFLMLEIETIFSLYSERGNNFKVTPLKDLAPHIA